MPEVGKQAKEDETVGATAAKNSITMADISKMLAEDAKPVVK